MKNLKTVIESLNSFLPLSTTNLSPAEITIINELQNFRRQLATALGEVDEAITLRENKAATLEAQVASLKEEVYSEVLSPVVSTLSVITEQLEALKTLSQEDETDRDELSEVISNLKTALDSQTTEIKDSVLKLTESFGEALKKAEEEDKSRDEILEKVTGILEGFEDLRSKDSGLRDEVLDETVSVVEDLAGKVKELSDIVKSQILEPGKVFSGGKEVSEAQNKEPSEIPVVGLKDLEAMAKTQPSADTTKETPEEKKTEETEPEESKKEEPVKECPESIKEDAGTVEKSDSEEKTEDSTEGKGVTERLLGISRRLSQEDQQVEKPGDAGASSPKISGEEPKTGEAGAEEKPFRGATGA